MIDREKLEEVLRKNWTHFLDSKKLMARVLQDANSAADTFHIVKKKSRPQRNMVQISVSRCQPTCAGFLLWVEFFIPRDPHAYLGTAEYLLGEQNDPTLRQIIGTKITMAKAVRE